MRGDVPPVIVAAAVVTATALCCLFVGSCVQDYAKSSPRVIDVLVTDKRHEPGHYDTTCSMDSGNRQVCSTQWVAPSWTVEYADEQRHWMIVSQGTYDALRIGDKKVLRYNLGGGYWHARYDERFEFGPLAAEVSWPAK